MPVCGYFFATECTRRWLCRNRHSAASRDSPVREANSPCSSGRPSRPRMRMARPTSCWAVSRIDAWLATWRSAVMRFQAAFTANWRSLQSRGSLRPASGRGGPSTESSSGSAWRGCSGAGGATGASAWTWSSSIRIFALASRRSTSGRITSEGVSRVPSTRSRRVRRMTPSRTKGRRRMRTRDRYSMSILAPPPSETPQQRTHTGIIGVTRTFTEQIIADGADRTRDGGDHHLRAPGI